MGMFDDVQCEAMRCPLCGGPMGWQSKDGPCLLETLTVHELMDQAGKPTFYTSCDDCRVWVEVTICRQEVRTAAQWEQFRREKGIIESRRSPGCDTCDGRKCMSCVMREWHEKCAEDCPRCCVAKPLGGGW